MVVMTGNALGEVCCFSTARQASAQSSMCGKSLLLKCTNMCILVDVSLIIAHCNQLDYENIAKDALLLSKCIKTSELQQKDAHTLQTQGLRNPKPLDQVTSRCVGIQQQLVEKFI